MKLWTGRFEASTHPILDAINKSIEFDIRLWRYDIRTNRAHVEMLEAVGLLTAGELEAILGALDTVHEEFAGGRFEVKPGDEDIHTAIERRVTELVGDPGRKMHTARSRNDQVATDVRLFTVDAIASIRREVQALVESAIALAERTHDVVMPAYTHLQPGQPVLMAHHIMAYVEMLRRDDARLADAAGRVAVSPLGSGACVGTSLPIDREMTAKRLGFPAITRNSLDGVSDRDFVLETLAALSILALHLSRLGEELVLWTSKEFGFCTLGDDVTTGSSMMPQKKNPDGAELIRGKAGRVFAGLLGLLTTMKGLPLAYNKDMQEDKEPLFDAVDTIRLSLAMANVMLQSMVVHGQRAQSAVLPEVFATDLAELLVLDGVPLRRAHEAVGLLVKQAERLKKTIDQLTPAEIAAAAPEGEEGVDPAFIDKLSIEHAIHSKDIPGGTAPGQVSSAIAEAKHWLQAIRIE